MNSLMTERLQLLETPHIRPTMFGPMQCVCVNAWTLGDPFPSLLVGSMLLVYVKRQWLLSHLLIEDEARRHGFATEIVRFYEDRLGPLGAAWVSKSGEPFARKYVERHGPRPLWQIGVREGVEAMLDHLERGGVA